jgi:hypothetical protein
VRTHFLKSLPACLCSHAPLYDDRRVQKFKSDYAEFRKEFERIKEEVRPVQPLP